ncbi:hypothetical protein [Mucilaginibacter sp. SMC90]|nr:hypothetical protein [Mucilaginibacter sp. SMC90]
MIIEIQDSPYQIPVPKSAASKPNNVMSASTSGAAHTFLKDW